MKNKFFGLLVLSTLVLVGCGQVQAPPKINLDKIKPPVLDNTVVPEPKEEPVPLSNEAIDKNNIVDPVLANTKTPKEISKLVSSFRIDTPEYARCLSDSVTMCQQNAIQEEIQKTKSVKPCNYLGDDTEKNNCRDNAWMSLALTNNNLDSCGNIVNESMKNNCLSSVSVQVAVKSGSAVGCKNIEDLKLKKQCQNSVYQGLATKNLDATICSKIDSDFEGEVDMCKDMVKMEKEMAKQNAKMEAEMKKEQERMEKEQPAVLSPAK